MNLKINILKDQLRRGNVGKETRRRHQLKWIIRAVHRSSNNKVYKRHFIKDLTDTVYQSLTYTKSNNSLTRVKNRCRISGNSSSVSRFFRLSRQSLKEEIKFSQQFVGVNNSPYSKLKNKKLKLHAL